MDVLKLCRWKLIGWGMSNMPHPKDPDMGISASKFVPHGAHSILALSLRKFGQYILVTFRELLSTQMC